MSDLRFPVPEALQSFVKNIVVLEHTSDSPSVLPFYADGFPGIMYRESAGAAILQPRNKNLSELFLYGQTIQPIEIHFNSLYTLIVFELEPFAVKMIFGVNPKELNDDCYNFLADDSLGEDGLLANLTSTLEVPERIELLSDFLIRQIQKQSATSTQKIKLAIDIVISSSGNISVRRLADQLALSERSLQRLFTEHVGVSPKQFAKIIQFKSSLKGLTDPGLSKLTNIVYEYGYADQSHFIRDFKKYTGDKPSRHKKKSV